MSRRGLHLDREVRGGRRRRNRIERHVDQRRDAAGGRGARRRLEAFPLRPAWFVDVGVRVDETGHDDEVAAIVHRKVAGSAVAKDGCDPAVPHHDRRCDRWMIRMQHDPIAAHGERALAHRRDLIAGW